MQSVMQSNAICNANKFLIPSPLTAHGIHELKPQRLALPFRFAPSEES